MAEHAINRTVGASVFSFLGGHNLGKTQTFAEAETKRSTMHTSLTEATKKHPPFAGLPRILT